MTSLNSTLKKKHPVLARTVTTKTTIDMNRSTSGVAGVIEQLKQKIAILDQEIKADKKGKYDYDEVLTRLKNKKADLEANLRKSREWAKQFDSDIGPFERKYAAMTVEMDQLYGNAKLEHAKGLQVLMDEFQYHPEFKRYSDEFTAVPFRPK